MKNVRLALSALAAGALGLAFARQIDLVSRAHAATLSPGAAVTDQDRQVCRFIAQQDYRFERLSETDKPDVSGVRGDFGIEHEPEKLDDFLVSSAYFDIDGDGVPEHLLVSVSGSAHWAAPAIESASGKEKNITGGPDENQDPDWRWANGGARWLILDGNAYVLRFSGTSSRYLRYMSRIDKNLVEVPICKFRPVTAAGLFTPDEKDELPNPASKAVCDAVMSHKVSYLPVQKYRDDQTIVGAIQGGTEAITAETSADAENIGKADKMFLHVIESGAGPGCEAQYFDAADAKLHSLLLKLQGVDPDDPAETSYSRHGMSCDADQPGWFSFQGKTYLDSRAENAEAPQTEDQEFRRVDVIENGVPRTVCRENDSLESRQIVAIWNGTGWAPP